MADRFRQTLKKHPKPVFWVGFSLAIVGLVLYLAQDPATIHVDSPVAAADSRFPDYVASLVGAPVHMGDAYTVLHNGDEAYPAMLAAIDGIASPDMTFDPFDTLYAWSETSDDLYTLNTTTGTSTKAVRARA